MLKNVKHLCRHHRGFVLLSSAYFIPATLAYLFTQDSQLSVGIGGLTILIAFPFIWKYIK